MADGLRNRDWTLTEWSLDRLLRELDPDRDRAGEKYETLRRKLITFFECRGCADAEDCADEVINRVARRLDEGEIIQAPDPLWYFLGVARNVARERHAMHERESRGLDHLRRSLRAVEPAETLDATPVDHVHRCLECLTPAERTLIIEYYRGDKRTKIANRQRLALSLRLAPNALRIRAHRIRQRLEACLRSSQRDSLK